MNRIESFLRTVGAHISFSVSFLCLLCFLVLPAQSWGTYTYTAFDLPSPWELLDGVGGINNAGTIVGSGTQGQTQGFIRTVGGTVTPIWSDGWLNASAQGINNNGSTVVGYARSALSGLDAGFFYNDVTKSINTIVHQDYRDLYLQGVNDSGKVAGYGVKEEYGPSTAFTGTLDSNGNLTALVPIIFPGTWTDTRAMAINDYGMVAGVGFSGGALKGFRYDSTALSFGFFDLPLELTGVEAMGINNIGATGTIVMGGFDEGSGIYRGFVSSGAGYEEILPPGWADGRATGINDDGTIVGWGEDGTGSQKGFIARVSSVPEPASLLFLLAGLGCLPLARRARKA